MKRFLIIFSFLALIGCSSRENKTIIGETVIYAPQYAEGFYISEDIDHNRFLTVKNMLNSKEEEQKYFLHTSSSSYEFSPSINIPCQRIVALSSSYVAMLSKLSCEKAIVGVSGLDYIINEEIRVRASNNLVFEAGYDANMNYELFKASSTDVVLMFSLGNDNSNITNKFEQLEIPYIFIGDYLENHPLGKAEWLVAIAALENKLDEGISIFRQIRDNYIQTKTQAEQYEVKPTVMLNTPYNDVWFMPNENNYTIQLIKDAGGDYIYKKNQTNSSQPISMEEAIELTAAADFWLNTGQYSSIGEITSSFPKFTQAKAIRTGRVYNNNAIMGPGGGSDYWESGAVNPDIILKDLFSILHKDGENLHYYHKLEN